MFTSRAEYRILLRQDNADQRLTAKSYAIGLANEVRYNVSQAKIEQTNKFIDFIKDSSVSPEEINPTLSELGTPGIKHKVKMNSVLSRPQVRINHLIENIDRLRSQAKSVTASVIEQAEIQIKYEGYISKEQEMAAKLTRLEHVQIPQDIDFTKLGGLSNEAKVKLTDIQPSSIGQASRISGVSPNDVSILLVYLGR